ncbi:MAG: SIS domain-containing protein [Acidimicrobiales bacterium]
MATATDLHVNRSALGLLPTMSPDRPLGMTMEAEITEQPAMLGSLIARRTSLLHAIERCFRPPLAGTVIVARGSSDHAATCGRYLLEVATRRPVASASPSLHLLYGADVDFSDYVVIAVSQSGRTPEVTRVLEGAATSGARTIAITNAPESPLAATADIVIALGVGEEKAVPATKTVTAEIAVFAMIAQAIGDIGIAERHWDALPDQVSAALADPAPCQELAAWAIGTNDRFATVARGYLYGAAAECALKVQETTSILATAFSGADLRHGPVAMASSGVPILAFVHPGPAAADMHSLIQHLNRQTASVRVLGPVPGSSVGWSAAAPEALAPILAVVRSQQLVLELARRLGKDPDFPEGLTKVTAT